MKIAVLFDGAGLARLGLERAGHDCTGFELNPIAHYLSGFVGSGNSILADVRDADLSGFDAVWASPPCQLRSSARTQGPPESEFSEDLLSWSLSLTTALPHLRALWVENIRSQKTADNLWGCTYNAAQFDPTPRQSRQRVIGGTFPAPLTLRPFKRSYQGVCYAITATEYKGCATDRRRASRFYGRRLTIDECAYHQGFEVPAEWAAPLPGYTPAMWRHELYRAIGNGVPVYMAEALGLAAI